MIMAAFLGTARQWELFGRRIRALQRRDGFTVFHAKDFRALMDRYRQEIARTKQGAVPIPISFPAFGPSVFLAAELTAEARRPSLDLGYHKTGGR